jgi:hypothetical protein
MGVKPQGSDHCGVWVEFFLRYPLSETGIASDYTIANMDTCDPHHKREPFEMTQLRIN